MIYFGNKNCVPYKEHASPLFNMRKIPNYSIRDIVHSSVHLLDFQFSDCMQFRLTQSPGIKPGCLE